MRAGFDIAVIGAGSAGLTLAAAAAGFGRSVILFEKAAMGGDCLNSGCVPSKALLAAARQAQALRGGTALGIAAVEPAVDFAAVMAHVRGTIAAIAPHDSAERFEGLGVTVVRAAARFRGPRTLEAGGQTFTARRMVIATGSRPAIPPVPGLADTPHFTNETLFANDVLPEHLLILGGGALGLEMAQAHRRLGARVSVIEAGHPLAHEDPELAAIILKALAAEGVRIIAGRRAVEARAAAEGGVSLLLEDGEEIAGSHLLVAAGRRPNVEGLNLAAAGVAFSDRGIAVGRGFRTSNPRIHAIGDVAGGRFTHEASSQAAAALRTILFGVAPRGTPVIPRVTYTGPELAQAGLTEGEAAARHGGSVKVLRVPFRGNDRAVAEAAPEGLVKVVAGPRGRILGAGIAAPGAGELILPWVLALSQGLGLSAMAGLVAPYPTRSEGSRRAAVDYFAPLASNPLVRRVIGLISVLRP